MVECPACAGENLDDARFRSRCGRALSPERTPESDVLGAYTAAMREEIEAEGRELEYARSLLAGS